MDSRDLVSSGSGGSSSGGGGGGGGAGDEDGLLSVTSGLAKEASLLFQSRRFGECVDVLNQLLQKKEDDPKVLHNIVVAECFRDGCSDPKKLLELLNKVKKTSEACARASGDQVEMVGSAGNAVVTGSKGNTATPHQFSTTSTARIAYTDEFDFSVAKLNIATVLFHLHEYENALSVLEPLYQNIEPIDETTALHICLLLVDVALASHNAPRAADVIQYLEKAFGAGYMISQGDNGIASQLQSSHPPVKTSSAPSNSTALEISYSDSSLNASENPLARTLSDEALEYETLLSTLDIGRQNLTRPPGFSSSNDISRTQLDQTVPAAELKLKLHLYKVRLLLLTRNLKAAKREMKLAMNISRGRDSSTALLLKSQLEYARGNHRKAIKLLMTLSCRTEPWMPIVFDNDFGCIYHQLKKPQASTLFFSKALKSSTCLGSENPHKLSTFSQDRSLQIVYNCGLQYLTSGKPIVAAQCFQKASSVFYNRPLVWLRIAECCLLALEKGILEPSPPPNSEVKIHVAGKGKWRQLIVEDGESRIRNLGSMDKDDGSLIGDCRQKFSIPFARQCLLNALHLLNSVDLKSLKAGFPSGEKEEGLSQTASNNHKNSSGDPKISNLTVVYSQPSINGDAKDAKATASLNTTLQSSISIYEDICRRENHMIKQAVLADLAYVELTLENPLKALSTAMSILRLQECSRIYLFLGHMYAAEALCRLNRLKEASEHVSIYLSDGNNAEFPYSEEDRETWRVEKVVDGEEVVSGGSVAAKSDTLEESHGKLFLRPEEALGTLYVNLAAMSAMQGDLEQAHQFATKALSKMPSSPQAILAVAYVDLLLGKSQDALLKLKRCSRVRFVSSGVKLNKSS